MTLINYSAVNSNAKRKLLLGNGFSIGVSSHFSYSSLREICQKSGDISDADQRLFNEFDTNDFELILERLNVAHLVNKALGLDENTPLERYDAIRDALIKAVKYIHPDFDCISKAWIKNVLKEFSEFEAIFTTNYDLLIYWIIANSQFKGFTDYFWSSDLTFDQFNTEIYRNNIPILYLHGALFLYTKLDRIRKIRANRSSLIDSVDAIWKEGYIPVFVSEGDSSAKKRSIYANPYLSFAFSQLLEARGGITIFGHSLRADQHIIDALNKNNRLNYIAVSIHKGTKTDERIGDEIEEIKLKFRPFTNRGGILEFFDSSTSPLAYA